MASAPPKALPAGSWAHPDSSHQRTQLTPHELTSAFSLLAAGFRCELPPRCELHGVSM